MVANILSRLLNPQAQEPAVAVEDIEVNGTRPQVQPAVNAMQATAPQAGRPRRSLLEILGQVGDVVAQVGGADPLYQKSLDADRMREQQIQDRNFAVAKRDEDLLNSRRTTLARGIEAISRQYGEDAAIAALPQLASSVGLTPEQQRAMEEQFAQGGDGSLNSFIEMFGYDAMPKYSLNPTITQDAEGNIGISQINDRGQARATDLGEGVSPTGTLINVNTGGTNVLANRYTGQPNSTFQRQEEPGRAADRRSRERIATMASADRRYATDRRAATSGAKAGNSNDATRRVEVGMGRISAALDSLERMGAVTSERNSTLSNLGNYAAATGIGQAIGQARATPAQTQRDLITQASQALLRDVATAAGMTGRNLDTEKETARFMQVIGSPTSSIEARRAALAGLRDWIGSEITPYTSNAAGRQETVTPARGSGNSQQRPSVSNW